MTQETEDRLQQLRAINQGWLDERPLMREHNLADLPTIIGFLRDEAQEALDSVQHGDPVIQDKVKAVEQELADIGWFLFTAFEVLESQGGQPMFEAMMEKMQRNILKYPAQLFQTLEDNYHDRAREAKEMWRERNGTHWFYNEGGYAGLATSGGE